MYAPNWLMRCGPEAKFFTNFAGLGSMPSNCAKLRVMYWPNEPVKSLPDSLQVGGRAAFEAMVTDGTIEALQIYSYRGEQARSASPIEFERSAMEAIRSFAPDILFVQHLVGSDVRRTLWQNIRDEMPAMTLVYHDDDAFGRLNKRIDQTTSNIIPFADLVLLSGLGPLASLFRAHGARDIGFMPSCFDSTRFGRAKPEAATKQHDVVMIGNCGRRRRLKFTYVPGGRRRAELVTQLDGRFGARFAIYGHGWNSSCAMGSRAYRDQEAVNQTGRITVNWDHFDHIDYYFSDRLPVALASGIPHVTTWHKGYNHLFSSCPGLYLCMTVTEAVETCSWLTSRSDDDLLEEGLAAREWAFRHLEANKVFRAAFEQAARKHARRTLL